MMMALALASALAMQTSPACRAADDAMLALPLHDFDQTDAGWRSLDSKGCEATAADAISQYRRVNQQALEGEYLGNLIWHEGQLRAAAGETDRAIALMLETHEETSESFAAYVDGTVAFLRGDRAGLLTARRRLAALPEPEYYRGAVSRFRATYPDKPAPTWPPNLSFLDGFLACFDKPYSEAYGCDADGETP